MAEVGERLIIIKNDLLRVYQIKTSGEGSFQVSTHPLGLLVHMAWYSREILSEDPDYRQVPEGEQLLFDVARHSFLRRDIGIQGRPHILPSALMSRLEQLGFPE